MTGRERVIVLSLICFAISLVYLANSYSATIYVKDYGDGTCSLGNAQSAYNAASDGDTIVFPSGTCLWSSGLAIMKPVSIIGAGPGAGGTKIVASAAMTYGFFQITGFTASTLVRISGFNFDLVSSKGLKAIYVHDMGGGCSNAANGRIRIDNNTFSHGSEVIPFYHCLGLIDNNSFYNSDIAISLDAGSRTNADQTWTDLSAGTANSVFIEDNTFVIDANYKLTYLQETIGSEQGGRFVARHNTFNADNMADALKEASTFFPIGPHGNAGLGLRTYWQNSGEVRRGPAVVEAYDNVMHGKRIDFMYSARGGVNIVHDNEITGTVRTLPRIALSEEEYFSDNFSPRRSEWPAEDQVHNSFFWNNRYNGSLYFNDIKHMAVQPRDSNCTGPGVPMACCTGPGVGPTCGNEEGTVPNLFIQKDRDYFLHAPQTMGGRARFTGLNGASRSYPTNGELNKGHMEFFANEANAYYGYTPYTYPHPLRSETGKTLNPPTLKIVLSE